MEISDNYLPDVIRRSYSRKLVSVLLVVVVLVTLIGVAIAAQTGTALEKDTQDTLVKSAELQADVLDEWIDLNEQHVRSVSASSALAEGESTAIRGTLEGNLESADESVVAIHRVDRESYEVLESTDAAAEGIVYADHDLRWIDQGVRFDGSGDVLTTSPYTDPVTDRPSIAFVSPVWDDADSAVVFVVDLNTRSETLEKASPADGAYTHVIDSEGMVVFSQEDGRVGKPNMDDDYRVTSDAVEMGLQTSGYETMEMHGEELAMGFSPVDGAEWTVMTHVPASDAFALQTATERNVLALVFVSLVGLGTIGVVVGRNTSQSLNKLGEKAAELEAGNYDADLETDRIDEIGALYGSFDSMRDSLRESMAEAESARKEAEHRRQKLATLARQLEEEATLVMEQAAAGDLTKRMAVEDGDESMSQVVAEYNEMMDGIEGMVEELKRFATDVAAHSEEVTASVEEVQAASQQVTDSVQEISSHTDEQHETFEEVSTEMDAIASETTRIAELTDDVSKVAQRTTEAGEDGRTAARKANHAMARIDSESAETLAEIEKLQTEIAEIEEMAEFITEVAKQTNVLALNANIEATRSDASAGGFSVVADEVKELATETKESAEAIEEVVQSIQRQMNRATDEVETTREVIATNMETIDSAGEALEEIAEHAETTYDGVQRIAAASQQQAASTEEVSGMVSEAATISDRVNQEAQTVAAAAQEQTSSLQDVTRSANDLASDAETLHSSLEQFETDAEVDRLEHGKPLVGDGSGD